jgi:indolepyruvate ferredoxin oxidoreductase
VFRVLARLKGLRGGRWTCVRQDRRAREERALIGEYRASIEEVLASLSADNHATAVEIARIPEQIKGFGHVKERHLKAARPKARVKPLERCAKTYKDHFHDQNGQWPASNGAR